MEDYCAITFKHISLEQGEKINNLIYNKKLIYNINKNAGSFSIEFLINNYDLNLNELIYNSLSESFCIITENDYKSLIVLLYDDSKQLINYNDLYYIIEIHSHFKFKGNETIVNSVKKQFQNNLQKKKI